MRPISRLLLVLTGKKGFCESDDIWISLMWFVCFNSENYGYCDNGNRFGWQNMRWMMLVCVCPYGQALFEREQCRFCNRHKYHIHGTMEQLASRMHNQMLVFIIILCFWCSCHGCYCCCYILLPFIQQYTAQLGAHLSIFHMIVLCGEVLHWSRCCCLIILHFLS